MESLHDLTLCAGDVVRPGAGRARVGLLGGTFNPVHIGHLLLGASAIEAFRLDHVLLMPCSRPPHKDAEDLAADTDRLAMLKAAVRGDTRFRVSTIEMQRGGVSYAVDTLREIKRRHPRWDLHFIMGMDMLRELHLWRDVPELLKLARFVTIERPGFDVPCDPAQLHLPLRAASYLLKHVVPGRRCDVSSREIRRRVAVGAPIRYLVVSAVEAIIRRRGLYRDGGPQRERHHRSEFDCAPGGAYVD